jgi:hypothetical protein
LLLLNDAKWYCSMSMFSYISCLLCSNSLEYPNNDNRQILKDEETTKE